MDRRLFLILYIFIGILDLGILSLYPEYRVFSKPLIMISLILFFLSVTRSTGLHKEKILFALALLFALSGDIFLIPENLFVFGLGSFLLMQIGYSVSFLFGNNFWGKREWVFTSIIAVISLLNLYYLWPSLDTMKIPVVVYTLAISAMTVLAFTRDKVSTGYSMILAGSIFFLVSDSLLAIQLFSAEIAYGGLVVMATYIAAQYLIVCGYTKYLMTTYT